MVTWPWTNNQHFCSCYQYYRRLNARRSNATLLSFAHLILLGMVKATWPVDCNIALLKTYSTQPRYQTAPDNGERPLDYNFIIQIVFWCRRQGASTKKQQPSACIFRHLKLLFSSLTTSFSVVFSGIELVKTSATILSRMLFSGTIRRKNPNVEQANNPGLHGKWWLQRRWWLDGI